MHYWTWCRGECFTPSGFCPLPSARCSVRHVEWTHRNRHQATARCVWVWSVWLLLFILPSVQVQIWKVSYYVAPADQTHHPPASTSWMLGSQTCATIPSLHLYFVFPTFVLQYFHSNQWVCQYLSLTQLLYIHVQWNLFSLPFVVLPVVLSTLNSNSLSYWVPRTPNSTLA